MNDKPEIKVGYVTPLKKICMTIGELPSSYLETMTYYEMLVWFTEFLRNKVIPTVDNNAEAVQELQVLYEELRTYVNDYFDNLDLQEEVDNKLDEMVEDGTLLNILSNYANLQRIYQTFDEVYEDTTLTENQIIKCFGEKEINDGNGGQYIINTTSGRTLQNGLKAQLLNNFENNFYDEITYVKERHNETDCYFVDVPLNDNNNEQINLNVEQKDYSAQTPLMHAQDNLTTLTINCGLAVKDGDTFVGGIVIGNGVVLDDHSLYHEDFVPDEYKYIGIKADRTIQDFQMNDTTLGQLQSAGCVNVFGAYFKLIENYFPVDLTGVITNDEDIVTTKHPRQVFCEMNDGSVKIMTCDGRTQQNQGLTAQQMQTILIAKGVKNAWNLDGGGSSSTSYKTFKINRNIDDGGRTDRGITYTLNAKRLIKNKNIADTYSFMSQLFHFLNGRYQDERTIMRDISHMDLNDLVGGLIFGMGTFITNCPTNHSRGYFINLTDALSYNYGLIYNKQLYLPLDTHKIYMREQYNNVWTGWIEINSMSRIAVTNKTISTTNTYEDATLNTVTNLDGNTVVKNEDNTFSFTTVKNRMVEVTCRVRGVAGNKYIQITKNGNVVQSQSNYNSDTGAHELVLVAQLQVSATTDKFKLQCYGNENDTFELINIFIR